MVTQHHSTSTTDTPQTNSESTERDPVCGMTVDVKTSAHTVSIDGHTYGFCCASCQSRFESDTAQYTNATEPVCGMQEAI